MWSNSLLNCKPGLVLGLTKVNVNTGIKVELSENKKSHLYINSIITKMIKTENGIGIIYLFYINFTNLNKA